MLETKINLIISSFTAILFSIIGFYYIFNDIVKNIKRNKIIKIKERTKMEREDYSKEIIPPSIFKLNNLTIDLDSVIGLSFKSGQYIQFMTSTNGCNYIISVNDLNFIEDTEELGYNSEYKVITDKFPYPYYDIPSSETKFSKNAEVEKLYNQLLKWKALRKLYLTAKIKATIYDYNFYSLIKDIKFIDVEKDVSKKLYQINYKVKMNSIYGITREDKQKEKKNEKLVYIEEDHPY